MIDWLRDLLKAIRDVIEIWYLVRRFQKLTDEQQQMELSLLREIVEEERAARRKARH